jgi:homocysteine S-methyltransferase
MDLLSLIKTSPLILTEGSVIERIRRNPVLALDPHISNSAFIYDPDGAEVLRDIYRQYIDIGNKHNLPIIILTPTWRANKERLQKSGYSYIDVNGDNFRLLNEIRKEYAGYSRMILIGGLIGCANDAYKPEESLTSEEAEEFHKYQLRQLAEAGVDFFIASTLPALSEAKGIAFAMSRFQIPYIISFVIRKNGCLLDGTPMDEAIKSIDEMTNPRPAFYMVNCVHPIVLNSAVESLKNSTDLLRQRLFGIQANTSCKSPEELEGLEILDTDDPISFSKAIIELYEKYGIKILGGCCGTDHTHINGIAEQYKEKILYK